MVSARKEGVPILRASVGHNIIFKPSLYKPEARKWAERYKWGLIGAPLFFFAAVGIALLLQWVGNEPIGFR